MKRRRVWRTPQIKPGLSADEIEKTIAGALLRGGNLNSGGAGAADFERTNNGSVKKCFNNAMVAVTALGIVARRNTFSDKIYLSNAPGSTLLPDEHEGLLSDNALKSDAQSNPGNISV